MFGLGMNCSLSVEQKKNDQNKELWNSQMVAFVWIPLAFRRFWKKTDCRLGVGQFTW